MVRAAGAVLPNKAGAADRKRRRRSGMGQLGAYGRETKRIGARLAAGRAAGDAACSRAREFHPFPAMLRDAKTGRFVRCRGYREELVPRVDEPGAHDNPRGIQIGDEVEHIQYRKRDGKSYRHEFETRAPVIGTRGGGVLIPGSPAKWDVIDGEPWLVNPPRKRTRRRAKGAPSGGKTMARGRNRRGQFTKGSGRRRSRRRTFRRLTAPVRVARRRSRRRGFRRNPPAFGGGGGIMSLVPDLKRLGLQVTGAAAARVASNQAYKFFPALATSSAGRAATALGSALVVGLAGGMFLGKQAGQDLAGGAFVVIADELVRTQVLPPLGLSALVDPPLPIFAPPSLSGIVEEGNGYDVAMPARLDPSNRL